MMSWLAPKRASTKELCDIYPSRRHVERTLLQHLYPAGIPTPTLVRFSGYTSEGGHDISWTASTCSSFLASRLPSASEVATAAGPVLYRILLHHGAWPFKPAPEPDAPLTAERFAIAAALLMAEDRGTITFQDPQTHSHMVHERPRDWGNRCRLLFQSLCNTDWTARSTQDGSARTAADDEDLVAVLCACMPQPQKMDRARFVPVAATLPSSHSRALDGRVDITSIRALLGLLLSLPAEDAPASSAEETGGSRTAVGAVVGAFAPQDGDADGDVDWERFRSVMAQSTPLLLTELAAFISAQFPGPRRGGGLLQVQHPRTIPPAMVATSPSSTRSSLTLPQLRQLSLVLPHPLLSTFSLLHQSPPSHTTTATIARLLAAPSSRLLLIRGGTTSGPYALAACVSPGTTQDADATKTHFARTPLSPPAPGSAWNHPFSSPSTGPVDCFVRIAPTHGVFRGSFGSARVDTCGADGLSVHLGGASMWFEGGLARGTVAGEGESVGFVVGLVEVWG
ncbi:hypothetical protein P171DRAFT_472072 [Karstenula rhodostoma CBS 690.94]|uniref:TLDc domain-containing protein n=1 Tax=Karstenula rhodostoma CBS 690.94 TaxID=1392251 RepID=A0A9P4PNY0_9PLEO|nr:hypothetical protein P171DRAFT_472072 [Karstenula rhodostoma CBS 690.94]